MGKVPACSAGIIRNSSSGLFFVRGDGFPWSAARAPGRPGLRPAPARPGRLAAPPSRSGSRTAGKESVLLRLDQARSPGPRGEESRSHGGSRTSGWNELWGPGGEAVADTGLGVGSRPWSGARGQASGSWGRPIRRGARLPAAREYGGERGTFPPRGAFVHSGLRAGVWRPRPWAEPPSRCSRCPETLLMVLTANSASFFLRVGVQEKETLISLWLPCSFKEAVICTAQGKQPRKASIGLPKSAITWTEELWYLDSIKRLP
ncbi:fibril-forming collagen alpha chain isoform X3 [Ovis aries]|uniref:fibril-forming collagen alpha chain isoform X3 n=1 Tax=Ovis aries TaxID=9940 RepID=UPI001C2E5BF0|nr:fibril-forming collagen alpha chain isoform X3 [Ovis aries]